MSLCFVVPRSKGFAVGLWAKTASWGVGRAAQGFGAPSKWGGRVGGVFRSPGKGTEKGGRLDKGWFDML